METPFTILGRTEKLVDKLEALNNRNALARRYISAINDHLKELEQSLLATQRQRLEEQLAGMNGGRHA